MGAGKILVAGLILERNFQMTLLQVGPALRSAPP